MTIQYNSQRFDLGSNGADLILSSPSRSLILPGNGLQSQGLELTHVSDEQPSIIIPGTGIQGDNDYSKVKGILVRRDIGATGAIEIIQAGSNDMAYGIQGEKFSFEEVLHNSLEKIIKSEAKNPLIEHVKEYFGRLESLTQLYRNDLNREKRVHDRASLAPLVMNRETFKEETHYPLKEFLLNPNSLEQLEKIVLKSLKMEDGSKSSSAKRFALRFLTNTVFIENFKSEKINQAVIQALKTDKEPAAKKIYEHYLTTQLGNLETSQKKEIIDVLNENNRLSSHLAQSLFLSEPRLKEGIETKKFPEINNFEDLEKILDNLHAHSKVAMNQVDLLPFQINPDANYGIEIELKLAGDNGCRDDTSIIQERLKHYADFIELGTDFGDSISEMRTGEGGFKLNKENQKSLFEIVNIFHQSPDLMLFLSQHVHVDKEFLDYPPDSLLSLMKNNNGVTLETKSLDLDTMQLNPNNNLVYSYQVPNLIDQMIVLEELKNTKPSVEAIVKSFELNKKYGISLGVAQVMLTAVENEKGYLIPNLLRLNNQGKNYLETNYLAENEGADFMFNMIDIDREDLVGLVIDKDPNVLMQFNARGNNAWIHAALHDKERVAKLIIDKTPEGKLGEVLTQVDVNGRNVLMIAASKINEGFAKLIIDKIPEDKLEEVLMQVDPHGCNVLMYAASDSNEGFAKLIMDKMPEDMLKELLIQVDTYEYNILMHVASSSDEGLVKLIMDKIPEEKLEEMLTQVNINGDNALMHVASSSDEGLAKLVIDKIPEDRLEEVLTQVDRWGRNALMHALRNGNEKLAKLIIDKIPEDKLEEVLMQVDDDKRNALMIATGAGNEELAKLIMDKIPEDKLQEVLNQLNAYGRNVLMIATGAGNEELAKLIMDKIPEGKLGEVLAQVDVNGFNTLMRAVDRNREELAKLIMDKIPENKLEEVLTQPGGNKRNALMIALHKGQEGLAKLIIDKIPKSKLEEVLTQVDTGGRNALMIASGKGIALSVLCPGGIIERLQMEL